MKFLSFLFKKGKKIILSRLKHMKSATVLAIYHIFIANKLKVEPNINLCKVKLLKLKTKITYVCDPMAAIYECWNVLSCMINKDCISEIRGLNSEYVLLISQ